jgi:hypothetical protein
LPGRAESRALNNIPQPGRARTLRLVIVCEALVTSRRLALRRRRIPAVRPAGLRRPGAAPIFRMVAPAKVGDFVEQALDCNLGFSPGPDGDPALLVLHHMSFEFLSALGPARAIEGSIGR